MQYFFSLGSNLGNKSKNLAAARECMQKIGICIVRSSSFYLTEPVECKSQTWFLNQAVQCESDRKPTEVLDDIKTIEIKMGRKETFSKGPRVIDIDILFAGDCILRTQNLCIPHPRIEFRKFVLVPLNEICPEFVHPVKKKSIKNLLNETDDTSEVIKLEADHVL